MSDKNFKVKNGIDAAGKLTITNTSGIDSLIEVNGAGGGQFTVTPYGGITTNAGISSIGGGSTFGGYGGTGSVVVNVRGASGQTGDLQTWTTFGGTILAKVDSTGSISATDLTLSGNLTVNGTTTNLNSTNLVIEDKNIIIADVATPTDTTADGAGITIKGATDKTFNWVNSTKSFTSSEPLIINNSSTTTIPLIVKGYASQTGDLTNWLDSNSNILSSIKSNGSFYVTGNSNTTWISGPSTSGTNQIVSNGNDLAFSPFFDGLFAPANAAGRWRPVNDNTSDLGSSGQRWKTLYSSGINVVNSTAANVLVTIKAASSQTGNLTEWQNNSGNMVAKLYPVNADSDYALYLNGSGNGAGSYSGIIIGGRWIRNEQRTSQSKFGVNTGEWHMSSNPDASAIAITDNQVGVFGNTANLTTFTVKAAASQTANLQEWQTDSGIVVANIGVSSASFMGTTASSIYNVGINSPANQNIMLLVGSTGFTNFNSSITTTGIYTRHVNIGTGDMTGIYSQPVTGNSHNNILSIAAAVRSAGGASAVITQAYNFYAYSPTISSGAITNLYGLFINTQKATNVTNAYGIYQAGIDDLNVINGRTTITSGSTTYTPLIIKGTASQTANLQEWQDSSGNVKSKIISDGSIVVGGGAWTKIESAYGQVAVRTDGAFLGSLSVGTGYTGGIGIVVKGVASQTANLQEWQNSAGTILANINPAGVISGGGLSISTSTNTINAGTFYNSAGTIVFNVDTTNNAVNIGGGLSGIANSFGSTWGYDSSLNAGYISFQTGIFGTDSLAIRRTNHVASGDYTLSTLGNLRFSTASGKNFNFNNGNIGIATTAIGTNNKIIVNPYSTIDNLATVQINTNAATNKGLVVQGYASQTANLQEWQNSSGTTLAAIGSGGGTSWYGGFNIFTGDTRFGTASYFEAETSLAPRVAGEKGLVIRGVASQSANLQEWQNNSGTVLAKVDASGNFSAITKSFDIPHPTKENMRLRYASLEGPENGVYIRGTADSNIIELPEYWTGLVHEDSITVSLTAVGSAQNIYVEKIEDNKVYIGGELKKAFFTVYGERKDIDKIVVEY